MLHGKTSNKNFHGNPALHFAGGSYSPDDCDLYNFPEKEAENYL